MPSTLGRDRRASCGCGCTCRGSQLLFFHAHSAGQQLAHALVESNVAKVVLAWNELRTAGGKALIAMLGACARSRPCWANLHTEPRRAADPACKLQSLDLSFNGLDDGVCEELERAFAVNTTLTELNLSHNRLGPPTGVITLRPGPDAGVCRFANALTTWLRVQALWLPRACVKTPRCSRCG